jgi:hypothetical protein
MRNALILSPQWRAKILSSAFICSLEGFFASARCFSASAPKDDQRTRSANGSAVPEAAQSQICVAPPVLELPLATVPSPPGLGYHLSRLRRSGFAADDSGPAHWHGRLGIGEFARLMGDRRTGTADPESAD